MEKIQLQISVDEANIILNALGEQPYIKVATLIQKLQQQGANQVNKEIDKEKIAQAEIIAS